MLALLVTLCMTVDARETEVMRGNLAAAVVLQRYLSSPALFRDPENAAVIDASLEELARLQHLKVGPTPNVLAELFAERVKEARSDFNRGRLDSARLELKGLTSMCLGCHSRAVAATGPEKLQLDFLKLSAAEKPYFLASVRQFDAALGQWKELLAKPPANALDTYDQLLALRAAVGVAVRAKDDPQLVLDLIATMRDRPEVPWAMHRSLDEWNKQAVAWKAERFTAATQRPAALFARAKALLEATPAFTSVAGDEEHLVALQRAAAYLNRALELDPKAEYRAEALYLLAVASAAAMDPELWQLDELYLEACVREFPHSRAAVRCVDRLADRIVHECTVSGITQVPAERASRLGTLRALAR